MLISIYTINLGDWVIQSNYCLPTFFDLSMCAFAPKRVGVIEKSNSNEIVNHYYDCCVTICVEITSLPEYTQIQHQNCGSTHIHICLLLDSLNG